MSYPSVFCVKCKSHTDILDRHTIQLSNNRRALKGVCPVCATETYRLMSEEKGQRETQLSLISSQRRLSPPSSQATAVLSKRSSLVAQVGPGSPNLNFMSRIEYLQFGFGEKVLHYGVLLILFGLSVFLGYMVCAHIISR